METTEVSSNIYRDFINFARIMVATMVLETCIGELRV